MLNVMFGSINWSKTVCSVFRVGMRGRELMGGVGKTMMQSGGTFGTFMAIGMGIRCWGTRETTFYSSIQLYSYGTFPILSTSSLCPHDAATLSTWSLVLPIKIQICQMGFWSGCIILSDAANVLFRVTDTKLLILSWRKIPPAGTAHFVFVCLIPSAWMALTHQASGVWIYT